MAKKPAVLPKMRPCPGCGVVMAEGKDPNGLAHHVCRANPADSASIAREMVAKASIDPDLTPDQAIQALFRGMLVDVGEEKGVSGVELAEIVIANAKAKAATGGQGADEKLYAFLKRRKDEELDHDEEEGHIGAEAS